MKKIIAGIVVIILIIAGISYFSKNSNQTASKEPIKIGVILPLSGDLAFLGEQIKKGIDLAIAEYKGKGINVDVIYEDDQSLSPSATVNAANKLLNIDKIDVGLTMLVEESRLIAPIFNKKEVPLLVLWDSNKLIQQSGDYIFSNGFSTELAGETMANFAYNELNLKTVAIVGHIDPWADIITKSFKDKFEIMGGKVVYDEQFNTETKDYRTAILKIKQLDSDAVYFPMIPMNSVNFLTQSKQLGLRSLFLTGDSFISDVIKKANDASEGVYFTNIYPVNNEGLVERYKKIYNNDPVDIDLISFGYDGVIKVVGLGNKKSSKEVKESLDLIFGSERSANRIEKIFKVQNGAPIEIKNN